MNMKKLFVIVIIAFILIAGGYYAWKKFNPQQNTAKQLLEQEKVITEEPVKIGAAEDTDTASKKNSDNTVKEAVVQKNVVLEENANLYGEMPNGSLPLSAIAKTKSMPENIRSELDDIFQNNNIYYMTKKNSDTLIIVTDNNENIRHNIEFIELSLINGHITKTTLGYNDKMQDSDNDKWEYEKVTKQPVRHTVYDRNGDIIFTENWNYDIKNPIKYEMKDANNKVISLRKETNDNDSDLRIEHLVYDTDGNTRINVSATYDGPCVKRFTYFNADKPAESGSIISEYDNGLKTKETVYSSDLSVLNIYTSEYEDGIRKNISIFDSQNNKTKELLSE